MRSKSVEFMGRRLMPVHPRAPLRDRNASEPRIETLDRSSLEVRVTSLERTTADVLDRPSLAGGIEGERYTVKKYQSEKIQSDEGAWRHCRVPGGAGIAGQPASYGISSYATSRSLPRR